MIQTQIERIDIVNEIIQDISTRGRYFFSGKLGVAKIFKRGTRLYMFNEYNGVDMCLNTKYGYPPKRWVHGGTLWALTKDFKDFIYNGTVSNGINGYGGLYCANWGYSEDDMIAIRDKAKSLGYL